MAGLFLGNRRGYYFYGIVLKNANVRLRFANRTYELYMNRTYGLLINFIQVGAKLIVEATSFM